ncbi:MAG: hypothetical protein JNK56_18455 [Myxococcales bacterium]|nr:hypothetical protein [Myxococcales bacterium]
MLLADLAEAEQVWGPDHPLIMDVLIPLSGLRLAAGDAPQAAALAERAHALCLRATLGPQRDYQHVARWHLARAYAELGRADEALTIATAVRDFAAARHGPTDASWIAEIDRFRGKLLAARGGK